MIGVVIDEKYRIDRELGNGGMGSVYLATHLGTERPVAVKVIAPQFMKQPEFVERFRREARAAGRLRHPNVVDVTDFGFDETSKGKVAYLVMEYLDGCTLGEVLDEEKNLPVDWTLDILDQICSAVHEAHRQGIIHRDLKPDNIWLEPNQRGGYTVKVLDFGIAKLEEDTLDTSENESPEPFALNSVSGSQRTSAGQGHATNEFSSAAAAATSVPFVERETGIVEKNTLLVENETIIQPQLPDDVGTQIFEPEDVSVNLSDASTDGAKPASSTNEVKALQSPVNLLDSGTKQGSSAGLTRVGAVLGTPLYMSPEQCRGEKLDARSDVYSLGVIAFQMLSGSTPFVGSFSDVMKAHRETPAPPLKVRDVRRRLSRVILSALEKDPDDRPQSAEAFAAILRARSEGIFDILRRAGMIYTSKMQKFILLSALFNLPTIIFSGLLLGLSLLKESAAFGTYSLSINILIGAIGVLLFLVTMLSTFLLNGTISWNVIHSIAMPLRPIRLRDSLYAAYKKWKRFAGTGILSILTTAGAGIAVCIAVSVLLFLLVWLVFGNLESALITGFIAGAVSGVAAFAFTSVLLMLAVSAVMMEDARPVQALKRSKELVLRSFLTATAGFMIMFFVPLIIASTISFSLNFAARGIYPTVRTETVKEQAKKPVNEPEGLNITIGDGKVISLSNDRASASGPETNLRRTIIEALSQMIFIPFQILITSFMGIISALLYLKTRQAGGEPLRDLLATFEKTGQPEKKWQERVRRKLVESGRVSGGNSKS